MLPLRPVPTPASLSQIQHEAHSTPIATTAPPSAPETSPDEPFEQKVIKYYNTTSHRKARFFMIYRNKAGYKFVETLTELLKPIANSNSNSSFSLQAAMLVSHLILPLSKQNNDGLVTRTMNLRLDMWYRGQIDDLFTESQAL